MPGASLSCLTLFSRILPAKSCTSGTVLSIGDPGAGPTTVRVAVSVWVLTTFHRSAANQLGMCRSPVGKLLLLYLWLLYKAEVGGGGTHLFVIPMRTWETN